ncbi:hypothetical protein K504DRAFT_454605 [Pleomassaria siparia CBS 279.74]|uniref:Uncharacterized protein n=1 Tax=Pleomassaria siparia CBS 279.74 TaxID=1314801 RepID=A0A6G1KD50_9PLEO|nr:hypothetical protein K504DRAFT_454605 [Pleomassaria siparia CBS 279.74]
MVRPGRAHVRMAPRKQIKGKQKAPINKTAEAIASKHVQDHGEDYLPACFAYHQVWSYQFRPIFVPGQQIGFRVKVAGNKREPSSLGRTRSVEAPGRREIPPQSPAKIARALLKAKHVIFAYVPLKPGIVGRAIHKFTVSNILKSMEHEGVKARHRSPPPEHSEWKDASYSEDSDSDAHNKHPSAEKDDFPTTAPTDNSPHEYDLTHPHPHPHPNPNPRRGKRTTLDKNNNRKLKLAMEPHPVVDLSSLPHNLHPGTIEYWDWLIAAGYLDENLNVRKQQPEAPKQVDIQSAPIQDTKGDAKVAEDSPVPDSVTRGFDEANPKPLKPKPKPKTTRSKFTMAPPGRPDTTERFFVVPLEYDNEVQNRSARVPLPPRTTFGWLDSANDEEEEVLTPRAR